MGKRLCRRPSIRIAFPIRSQVPHKLLLYPFNELGSSFQGAIPCHAQGLLLALHTGIKPGGVQETIQNARDWTQDILVQSRSRTHCTIFPAHWSTFLVFLILFSFPKCSTQNNQWSNQTSSYCAKLLLANILLQSPTAFSQECFHQRLHSTGSFSFNLYHLSTTSAVVNKQV